MQPGKQSIGHPIDLASGVLHSEHLDAFIPGRVDLVWERRYSTSLLDGRPGPLGPGWSTRYFATLLRTPAGFELATHEGGLVVFDDAAGDIERGRVLRDLGTFQGLQRRGSRNVLTRWSPDTGAIDRYVFAVMPVGAVSFRAASRT